MFMPNSPRPPRGIALSLPLDEMVWPPCQAFILAHLRWGWGGGECRYTSITDGNERSRSGCAVLLGLQARLSALSLFLYLIFTTRIFPNFRTLATGQQQLHAIIFLKNLVVMGGVALVWAFGMGSYSLDTRKMRNGK